MWSALSISRSKHKRVTEADSASENLQWRHIYLASVERFWNDWKTTRRLSSNDACCLLCSFFNLQVAISFLDPNPQLRLECGCCDCRQVLILFLATKKNIFWLLISLCSHNNHICFWLFAICSEFSCLTFRLCNGPRWKGAPSRPFSVIFGTSSTASHLSRSLLLRKWNIYIWAGLSMCCRGRNWPSGSSWESQAPQSDAWLSVASQHFWFNIQRTGEQQPSGLVIGDEVGTLQPPHVVPCSLIWFWKTEDPGNLCSWPGRRLWWWWQTAANWPFQIWACSRWRLLDTKTIWEGVKKRTFYGQADHKRLPATPPTPCDKLFVNFRVFFILDYEYMCSETDFTQEKSHFHPTSKIPNSSFLFAAALSQNGWKVV